MRFWDTSALIPLFVAEHSTTQVERQLREDPEVVLWTLTRVELFSAFARRRRAEPSAARRLAAARREVLSAWEHWSEVTALDFLCVGTPSVSWKRTPSGPPTPSRWERPS